MKTMVSEIYDVTLECIDFMNYMLDMGYDKSAWALTVMWNTYKEHAKVRIAFKHMKAGLMDKEVFYKLALRYRFY